MKNLNRFILTITILLLPSLTLAQVNQIGIGNVLQPEKGSPINIKSETLVIRNNENVAIFQKNVHATQGKMKLDADEMKLFTDYDPKTKKSRFKRIEAAGNVKFDSGKNTAESNLAVYDVATGVLTLTNNVVLKEGDNSLEGGIFTYNVRTGKTQMKDIADQKIVRKDKDGKIIEDKKTAGKKTGRARASFIPGEDMQQFTMPVPKIDAKAFKDVTKPVEKDQEGKTEEIPEEKKE